MKRSLRTSGLVVVLLATSAAASAPDLSVLGLPADFTWRVVTRNADVTLDGRPDVVAMGSSADETAVAVVEGPARAGARRWVLRFRHGTGAQDGLCGTPKDAGVRIEDLGLPLEEWGCAGFGAEKDCAELRALEARLARAARRGSKGVRLDSGDCDAIHVYFDGTRLDWWRR